MTKTTSLPPSDDPEVILFGCQAYDEGHRVALRHSLRELAALADKQAHRSQETAALRFASAEDKTHASHDRALADALLALAKPGG
jgi:hypothetical protein